MDLHNITYLTPTGNGLLLISWNLTVNFVRHCCYLYDCNPDRSWDKRLSTIVILS